MTSSIQDKYLQAAHQLEYEDFLASNAGNNSKETQRLSQRFQDLGALYSQAFQASLEGSEREEIKRVHAQVSALFVPKELSKNISLSAFFEMRNVHYLRIALEHNLQKKVIAEQFAKLTYPQMRTAFKLLNTSFGRPTGKTNTDGMIHIAKNPLNLLAHAKGVKDTPRIIDILLQDPAKNKLENLQQSTAHLASSSITVKSPGMAQFTASSSNLAGKINSAQLFTFYQESMTGGNNQVRCRIDLLCQERLDLMTHDEEIRWLFPLEQDVDDYPSFFTKFVADPWCKTNLKNTFKHMLGIYGLEFDENAVRSVRPKEGVNFLWLLPQYKHWQTHIERIMKCLVAMNMHAYAYHFLLALEDVAKNNGTNAITQSNLKTWKQAVPSLTSSAHSALNTTSETKENASSKKLNADQLIKYYKFSLGGPGIEKAYISTISQKETDIMDSEQEIRWLFPLNKDVDDPSFFAKAAADRNYMIGFNDGFKYILKLYGLEQNETTLTVSRREFPKRRWLNQVYWHWQNHIERILKCLITMGMFDHAKALLAALEDIAANEGKSSIPQDTLKTWRNVVSSGKINCESLLDFYANQGKGCYGKTRDEILSEANNILLLRDDNVPLNHYEKIRWLFPLKEDVDDASFVSKFSDCWDMRSRSNLISAFCTILSFYGLELDKESVTIDPEGGSSHLWLLDKYKHWQIHIPRILKCLNTVGLPDHAKAFLAALEKIAAKEGKEAISQATLETWKNAVGEKSTTLAEGHQQIVNAATKAGTLKAETVQSDSQGIVTRFTLNKSNSESETKAKALNLEQLLQFYEVQGKNSKGRTREEMLKLSNAELLSLSEDEIRWLFPTKSDVLDEANFRHNFRNSIVNFQKVVTRMLDAYHLELNTRKMAVEYKAESFHNLLSCLSDTSNHKHIERILRCLTELGFENVANSFMTLLRGTATNVITNVNKAISQATLETWENAVKKKKSNS